MQEEEIFRKVGEKERVKEKGWRGRKHGRGRSEREMARKNVEKMEGGGIVRVQD